MSAHPSNLTLAVHPDRKGFGWVAFNGPFSAYDWGRSEARRNKNSVCLSKIEALIERLTPQTVVLEAYERPDAIRAARITRLCRAIMALAADRGLEVAVYTRADVTASFLTVGARTRDEIAEAVARHVDTFRHRLPKRRKPWQAEDTRMALFSAAALVLTHYRLGASTLFDDLQQD
jgi:Holliday junction resolvasome RuvABC endonuclease subunit